MFKLILLLECLNRCMWHTLTLIVEYFNEYWFFFSFFSFEFRGSQKTAAGISFSLMVIFHINQKSDFVACCSFLSLALLYVHIRVEIQRLFVIRLLLLIWRCLNPFRLKSMSLTRSCKILETYNQTTINSTLFSSRCETRRRQMIWMFFLCCYLPRLQWRDKMASVPKQKLYSFYRLADWWKDFYFAFFIFRQWPFRTVHRCFFCVWMSWIGNILLHQ